MGKKRKYPAVFAETLEHARIRLARPDALVQLALLGLATGIAAGGVIVGFRLLVEGTQAAILPGGEAENYEGLFWPWRLLLPVLSGLALALLFRLYARDEQVLGVARVMERMAYHQGHLSKRGFLLQFAGAAIALVGGHSVGREGPHVYLGAASGSLLGQWLDLPNNSIRTLVGCGVAAGIAASFNTPLAGVIFSLEVVMMEYTLASFIPVILAAAVATLLSNAVFGTSAAFQMQHFELEALRDIPVVALLGIAVGVVAAAFIQLMQMTAAAGRRLPFAWRLVLAGGLGGVMGVLVPEVMGIGYDTLERILAGQLVIGALLVLVLAKVLATTASVGLGVPGGMIGPSLFIGACLGGVAGWAAQSLGAATDLGVFVLIGMGAMMGASLQAPLAALTAMMELTHSPGIIMPGMLAVVMASLTASELFGKESLFITMLKASGKDYRASPILQALRRTGVAGVMSSRFVRTPAVVEPDKARELLAGEPAWLLYDGEKGPAGLLRALDLAGFLDSMAPGEPVDLREIPGERHDVVAVNLQATLQEALDILNTSSAEALYVERMTAPGIRRIYGILTREMVESSYRY